MPLSNSQYDAIMRGYDRRQYEHYREQLARIDEIYARFPRVREIQEEVSACSVRQAEQLFDGDPGALPALRGQLDALRQERERILTEAGYPPDYLEMRYTCPDCRDTGYIGRRKCHCFRQEEIRLLYSSSHLETVLEKESFSTLRMDVYDEEQRRVMPAILRSCHEFADHFRPGEKNLLFYGSVGTGKTFLSNCIAKELLDQGYSVIYFTSFQLFELLSRAVGTQAEQLRESCEPLLGSDLLILDDMGTELPNTFTVSRLFQILNERALAGRSTVISTNLSLEQFRDIYSERIFSRITSSYTLLKFTGGDIRIRRKINDKLF
ncbi:MAG: ATP-binding protein [Lachnospiraceae bacterium]|nr:ATP-binding protein [Lachnospiraceae bacterium]